MTEKPKRPFSLRTMGVLRKVLPRRVYYRYVGRHEKGSARLWRGIVAGLPEGACVLDIGAFHGDYALAARALRADLHIHAFEPNPASREHLTQACVGRDIAVEPMALAEQAGAMSFLIDGRRSQIYDPETGEAGEQVAVEVTTLDEWSRVRNTLPSLMKTDVEGGEAAVFRGGRTLLERARPIILCEVLTDEAGRHVADALPDGYQFFEIDEDRGTKQAQRPTRRLWRYCNWLLVPEERRGEIGVW